MNDGSHVVVVFLGLIFQVFGEVAEHVVLRKRQEFVKMLNFLEAFM